MSKVKGLEKVDKLLKRFFIDEVYDQKTLDEISTFVIERIRAFTRSGKSIAGPKPRRLKPLSESYKDVRRGATKWRTMPDGRRVMFEGPDEKLKEVDSEFFSPEKSNLTFSGQMLRALKATTKKLKRVVSIEVSVDDTRRTGKYEKLTNAEVAEYVAQNGRPFLGLDDKGVERVRRVLLNSLRKSLVKLGLK